VQELLLGVAGSSVSLALCRYIRYIYNVRYIYISYVYKIYIYIYIYMIFGWIWVRGWGLGYRD